MKIDGTNVKQIRRGVYYARSRSTVNVGRYRYTIPEKSVVIPEENLIYVRTHKGCYEWKYIPSKELWIVREIGDEGTKITAIDPHNLPNDDAKIIVTEQDNNKVHIFRASPNGSTTNEWRFFTSFFIDVIRKSDLAR